ncbi:uncharacterized protein LOC111040159 [Myzus persicae]|uniref:uncharacterized protein LOC111040159 n=1 Tax=Myzus persicae TaxID=13164 RepID=UPI000B935271|nr:uncharacterized protein LOC111040159 [Myzus persicae]
MHSKVTSAAWLLAILFISQTICQDKDDKDDKDDKKDNSSGSSGNKTGSGNRTIPTGIGNMTFNMNGMSGIQLPFPFFPPFGCDLTCQPMQLQVFQQQQVQQQPVTTTTQAPTTTKKPKTTTPAPRPAPTTTTYTSQTVIMYPNWCQGWCRFFYQPPPQPVFYQPNCLLFSWMGMGSGMPMGMQTTTSS